MLIFCNVCHKKKQPQGFHSDRIYKNGRGWCKDCVNKKRRERWLKNKDEYNLKRNLRFKKTYNRVLNAKKISKYKKQYKARWATRRAVLNGHLIKKPCNICGDLQVVGHHKDYNKPLEVIWLCDLHHKELHGQHYPKNKEILQKHIDMWL